MTRLHSINHIHRPTAISLCRRCVVQHVDYSDRQVARRGIRLSLTLIKFRCIAYRTYFHQAFRNGMQPLEGQAGSKLSEFCPSPWSKWQVYFYIPQCQNSKAIHCTHVLRFTAEYAVCSDKPGKNGTIIMQHQLPVSGNIDELDKVGQSWTWPKQSDGVGVANDRSKHAHFPSRHRSSCFPHHSLVHPNIKYKKQGKNPKLAQIGEAKVVRHGDAAGGRELDRVQKKRAKSGMLTKHGILLEYYHQPRGWGYRSTICTLVWHFSLQQGHTCTKSKIWNPIPDPKVGLDVITHSNTDGHYYVAKQHARVCVQFQQSNHHSSKLQTWSSHAHSYNVLHKPNASNRATSSHGSVHTWGGACLWNDCMHQDLTW